MNSVIDDIIKDHTDKPAVRYQVAFYLEDKMLGGFDIDKSDLESTIPTAYDDIGVNGTFYEVQDVRRKYLTEHSTVVFCVYLQEE